jgi:hypothetical protein
MDQGDKHNRKILKGMMIRITTENKKKHPSGSREA